jgi:hypothetical protein
MSRCERPGMGRGSGAKLPVTPGERTPVMALTNFNFLLLFMLGFGRGQTSRGRQGATRLGEGDR